VATSRRLCLPRSQSSSKTNNTSIRFQALFYISINTIVPFSVVLPAQFTSILTLREETNTHS
jgi:hypothetical protein